MCIRDSDSNNIFLEIRAGTGGEEAALFSGDLMRMYSRYAEIKKWEVEFISISESDLEGYKEVIMRIIGDGAYSRLKFESGVHRVQRVPETESQGRIHTSACTVAVLPEADEIDIKINPDDLRIDIFHAGGHGGQNVNKVATAVRIVYEPTNLVVVCQDERSQHKNKQRAMSMLRAKLFESEQQKHDAEISENRKSQVGTAERSEKIRTYNYPQDRITDHRISGSFHGVQKIMDGELNDLIDALASYEQAQLLEKVTA